MCDHPDLREVPLSEKPMFEGVLIDVSHMQVRLPNGQTALREVVHHKGAAAVVPVDAEGNVYLVRQHRVVVDPDPDEFLHVEKLPLAEAVRRVMAGELRDAKTALGLLMAWEKLRG